MKFLSTVQVLLVTFKIIVREPMFFIMTTVVPAVLTAAISFLIYLMFTSLIGFLFAAPFTFLVAYPLYYLITLASINIYLACGGKEEICYGISDDCELIDYVYDDSEVAK